MYSIMVGYFPEVEGRIFSGGGGIGSRCRPIKREGSTAVWMELISEEILRARGNSQG